MRCGGNFYIDVGDVIAASKAQHLHLHQLLKYGIIPDGEVCTAVDCHLCISAVDVRDLQIVDEILIS